MCRGTKTIEYVKQIDKRITILFICCLIIIFSLTGKPPYWLLCGRTTIYDSHVSIMLSIIVRFAWFVSVLIASICILNLIPPKGILSKYGGCTLTVYLLHVFPIWILRKIGFKSDSILILLCIALAITISLFYLHRFSIIRFITNPMSITQMFQINRR